MPKSLVRVQPDQPHPTPPPSPSGLPSFLITDLERDKMHFSLYSFSMIIRVPRREFEAIVDVAKHRWLEKQGSTNRPNYQVGQDNGSLQHELIATIGNMIAEMVVAYAIDENWNFPVHSNRFIKERGKFGDVGHNVEVRTVRTRNEVPIWPKDAGKIVYACKIVDEAYFSEVEVYGFVSADEAMSHPEYFDSSPNMNGWRYPLSALTPIIPTPAIRVALID